ncbi:conjugal transfer protein TraC [Methylobacterium variabile]|jgi:TraC-like protein|uniref:Conjugal transfer protein TraC n=1 Tax=Methylobacterium variabile TaxID=298794 RepID=A0A0J6SH63_9HYPH|nr:TraC family protein [Methylobacterium variabile]KMO33047.1 conjugal transfer protein TraC [Methylobacterium variabile]
MARSKSREAIVKEIEALQSKLKKHDKAEAERLGGLAIKAGIGSIDISDEDFTRELEAIVKRFRGEAPQVAEPKAKGPRGAGQAPEGTHDEAA